VPAVPAVRVVVGKPVPVVLGLTLVLTQASRHWSQAPPQEQQQQQLAQPQ